MEIIRSPWLEYLDDDGWGLCQPDAVIVGEPMVVVEVKLRQTDSAYEKLRNLYMPVVEFYWQRKVVGLQVVWAVRNPRPPVFMGRDAEIILPVGEIGTWFLRV